MLVIRYAVFATAILGSVLTLFLALSNPWWLLLSSIFIALSVLGVLDMRQNHSTLRRNYPIAAHIRYIFEELRPMLRQYIVEADDDEVPFSHDQRALVYQRAKSELETRAFGTEINVYGTRYEWINHSISPTKIPDHNFRISIGGPDCKQPYSASIFNISAMSFGSLSPNAIRALNKGAHLGQFYHDTGEGSISSYHRENGGDMVWELGSGYFGARNDDGTFSPERFAERASLDQVKMIELKLSQGAKPGHGGMLPGAKVNAEIASTRGVPEGQDCISPAAHSAFSTPEELLQFIAQLRKLSGGKPTGFKLAIGHPWEWFAIAKAMLSTGITPDFIVVDGAEGGTGAAPLEFADHIGTPMREGLMLVHNTLVGIGVRDKIKIGAAGKIITAFDIARTLALGADWCNSARGFMFALGCIQSQVCHTDRCPTGIATQNPKRWKGLDVQDKATRVHNFHTRTVVTLGELIEAAGLQHPNDLGPEHIIRRVSPTLVRSLGTLHPYLQPGDLLNPEQLPEHIVFQRFWPAARSDSFAFFKS